MRNSLEVDEEHPNDPQPDSLLQMTSSQEVQNRQQRGHSGQIREKLDIHRPSPTQGVFISRMSALHGC
jgi:hypothetical protein